MVSTSVGAGTWRNQESRTWWLCQWLRWDCIVSFARNYSYLSSGISLHGIIGFQYLTLRVETKKKKKRLSTADISMKLLLKIHFHQLLPSVVQAGLAEEEAAASHHQQTPVKIHTQSQCFSSCHHKVNWRIKNRRGEFTISGCWGRFTGAIGGTAIKGSCTQRGGEETLLFLWWWYDLFFCFLESQVLSETLVKGSPCWQEQGTY